VTPGHKKITADRTREEDRRHPCCGQDLKKKCFVVLIRRELPSMFPVKSEEEKPNIPIDHKLDQIS